MLARVFDKFRYDFIPALWRLRKPRGNKVLLDLAPQHLDGCEVDVRPRDWISSHLVQASRQ
jgi:hypothetical protein